MPIINFKKPISMQGQAGTNGTVWASRDAEPLESPFGGYVIYDNNGHVLLIPKPPDPPPFAIQLITKQTISSVTTDQLISSFTMPIEVSSLKKFKFNFNRYFGGDREIILSFQLDSNPKVSCGFFASESYLQYPIVENEFYEYTTGLSGLINIKVFAKLASATTSVTNTLGPSYLYIK